MTAIDATGTPPLEVSIVVPVFRGESTLGRVVGELEALTAPTTTPDGRVFRLVEAVLVWDHGPDASDRVIAELVDRFPWVRPIWLSRGFGQHPATVAGMAATRGEWVVTMDEDGQHDPADIARLLDRAYAERSELVYAAPVNRPPHSWLRNLGSSLAKGLVLRALTGARAVPFHSFRLVHGPHARVVAAFCGPGVYLDVALSWVIGSATTCPARMRAEGRPSATYSYRRLVSHFWRLVLSSGNRPLRLVSGIGLVTSALGVAYSVVLVAQRLSGETDVQGWTSAIVATLLVGGLILVALGIIAEYVGLAAGMSMGKPAYVPLSPPFWSRTAPGPGERAGGDGGG